ncbi:hypothetical protein OROHE_016222 [Orobanche hederae]
MHRSTSYSSGRLSDHHHHEFLASFSSSSPAAAASLKGLDSSKQDTLLSGNYYINNVVNDAVVMINDDVSKKDMCLKPSRQGGGERAIHLIPLVLFLCALVLWWFSSPVLKLQ